MLVNMDRTTRGDHRRQYSIGMSFLFLSVVLYGCEAWSLTAREERKLRVFENMVLRRIFGPRRDEVTREWRRFRGAKWSVLLTQYCAGDKIEKNEMGWACGSYGGREGGPGGETGGRETAGET